MVKTCAFAFLLVVAQSSNPEYDRWAGCKVGSWVKFKMESPIKDDTYVLEFTYTLLELSPEKAVLEHKSRSAGLADSVDKETVLSNKDARPVKSDSEGEEEIEAGGKKLKCHWVKGTQTKLKVKYWYAKEVPGGLVKADIVTEDGVAMKMIATSWKKD